MRKKQRHGGLSPYHVRLVRKYLKTLYDPNVPQAILTSALFAWIDIVMDGCAMAAHRLQTLGLASGTVKALRSGLEVMKRKRVGRIWDWSPQQSFAALGTRFMVTVAGFYCQIRNQASLVLPSVSRENFQLAFDLIQPIVSGNADVNSDEIPPDLLSRAMQYTTATMLEVHDIRTNVRVVKLLSTRIMDESVTDRFGAVDGMFILGHRLAPACPSGAEWVSLPATTARSF